MPGTSLARVLCHVALAVPRYSSVARGHAFDRDGVTNRWPPGLDRPSAYGASQGRGGRHAARESRPGVAHAALCPMRLRHGEQVSLRVQRGSRRFSTRPRPTEVAALLRTDCFRFENHTANYPRSQCHIFTCLSTRMILPPARRCHCHRLRGYLVWPSNVVSMRF